MHTLYYKFNITVYIWNYLKTCRNIFQLKGIIMLNSVVVFTSNTKLSFNVITKRVSHWHTNKPLSSLPKDHSFTIYCAYNSHFNSVCTHIQFSPYAYTYTFIRECDILPCHVLGLCLSVRKLLSPENNLTLSHNSILHVQP